MKHTILIFLLCINAVQLHAAATTNPPIFQLICNEPNKLTVLEPNQFKSWAAACRAITASNSSAFKKCDIKGLVNKVYFIYIDNKPTESISTLLEAVIEKGKTTDAPAMIEQLLDAGAHTDVAYGINRNDQYTEHYVPLYYTIITSNMDAFASLWNRNNQVSLASAMALWKFPDTEEPTAKDFLQAMHGLAQSTASAGRRKIMHGHEVPTPHVIKKMLAVTEAEPSSSRSCALQ